LVDGASVLHGSKPGRRVLLPPIVETDVTAGVTLLDVRQGDVEEHQSMQGCDY
jgi:hypothetical protein